MSAVGRGLAEWLLVPVVLAAFFGLLLADLVDTARRRRQVGADWEPDGGMGWEDEYP